MKISKLFHWLYAFLMFLPVTFLLPTLLYFGFNDNATAQEYTKDQAVYYQTNDVEDIDDIYIGNIYRYNNHYVASSSYTQEVICDIDIGLTKEQFPGINTLPNITRCFFYYIPNSSLRLFTYYGEGQNTAYDISNITFSFIPTTINRNLFENVLLPYVSSTDYKYLKGYEEVTYTMGITESVNQSILDTFDLPMFSWTSDNFIIAPFNYITDLFGLPSDNVVNKYLDYWLSISIIYLCFDVIMYVPLLVHRWLDKGIVE